MAQADNTGHLSLTQENAIDLLLLGKRDGEVAEAVGVTRQTVNGWRNTDAPFVAELHRRRADLWRAELERLRGLVAEAIDVLAAQLEEGTEVSDRVRQAAAVHVLRAVGLYGTCGAPGGSEDPELLEAQWRQDASLRRLLVDM